MSNREQAIKTFVEVNKFDTPITNTPMSDAALDFVFGTVWNTPGLSTRERRLISLTCAAISAHALPLEVHVRSALKSGDFTKQELETFLLHLAAYAGFPVAAGTSAVIHKIAAEFT
jgi:4-carboxymuconolactone decarboxylase